MLILLKTRSYEKDILGFMNKLEAQNAKDL